MPGTIELADEQMLRAELRGADYGIFVALGLAEENAVRAEEALAATVTRWPSLATRVEREGGEFRLVRDVGLQLGDYATDEDLGDRTLLASSGQRLFRFRVPSSGRLELLAHHLVLDADSLTAFLADLDTALSGGEPEGEGQDPFSDNDIRVATTAFAATTPLSAKRGPTAGTHSTRVLTRVESEAITAAARTCGVTGFAIYWAAAATLGEATLGTVVSSRLSRREATRGGNRTRYLSVPISAADSLEPAGVRDLFTTFIGSWSAPATATTRATGETLVSLSSLPDSTSLTSITAIELGDYVVKYPRHIQIQIGGEGVVIESYADTGAQALLADFIGGLSAVLTACGSEPIELADTVAAIAPVVELRPGPLERILAASPATQLRDLGISSLDVLDLLESLHDRFGVRAGVDAFYSWEIADDVQRLIQAAGAPSSPEPATTAGPVLLPHLNDIFIDAFRHAGNDPYAVEFGYVVDPALKLEFDTVATAVADVIGRHESLSATVAFSREGVILNPGADPLPIRRLDVTTAEELRDPRPLGLRAPAHLADVAVARLGHDIVVYLNVHHLLIDAVGLSSLLTDFSDALTGADPRPTQTWREVVPDLDRARASARGVWVHTPEGFPRVGTSDLGDASYVHARVPWGTGAELDFAAEVARITAFVAALTGESRGIIGSVHHGRTGPGSARLVGNLARVLPVHYDLDDPRIVAASANRVLAGQSATMGDLGLDAGQPMPIVFHVLRDDAGLPRAFVRQLDFPARTKFGLLLTLVIEGAERTLEITAARAAYGHADVVDLLDLADRFAPTGSPTRVVGQAA